jgi:hypothetical protein
MLCFVSPISAHEASIGPHPSTIENIPMESPLFLPSKGEDLLPGRQYFLSAEVRENIKQTYGYRNLPRSVVCLRCRVAATIVLTRRINLETGQVTRTRYELSAQAACFHVPGTKIKFEIDLALFPVIRMKAISPAPELVKEAKVSKRKVPDLSLLD